MVIFPDNQIVIMGGLISGVLQNGVYRSNTTAMNRLLYYRMPTPMPAAAAFDSLVGVADAWMSAADTLTFADSGGVYVGTPAVTSQITGLPGIDLIRTLDLPRKVTSYRLRSKATDADNPNMTNPRTWKLYGSTAAAPFAWILLDSASQTVTAADTLYTERVLDGTYDALRFAKVALVVEDAVAASGAVPSVMLGELYLRVVVENNTLPAAEIVGGGIVKGAEPRNTYRWDESSLALPENDIDLNLTFAGGASFSSGVLAPNGKVYCIPNSATYVMIIDPTTDTTDTTSIPCPAFMGNAVGVLASNGKIYCAPFLTSRILVIDTIANTFDTSLAIPGYADNWYYGACLGPNGKVYCIPAGASRVLVIDPRDDSYEFLSELLTATTFVTQGKWQGGVLAPNGSIYGIPFSSSRILEINPATNTCNMTFTSATLNGGLAQWRGGCLAPNGKIVGFPRNRVTALSIDTTTTPITVSTIGAFTGAVNTNTRGGCLGANGKAYAMPSNTTFLLVIDPEANTLDTIAVDIPANRAYNGGVLAPNGTIYGIPISGSRILKVKTGIPVLPPWPLMPQFNKT